MQIAEFSRARLLPTVPTAPRRRCKRKLSALHGVPINQEAPMSTRVSTLRYLSPEVAIQEGAADAPDEATYGTALDVWSFGVTLFEALEERVR